jgi:hypothetical protein
MRKAFGRFAGILAMVVNLVTLAALMTLLVVVNVPVIVSVMTM